MSTLYWLLWSTLFLLLILASIIDWRKCIIPNTLVIIGAMVGILEHTIFQGISGLFLSLFGGIVWLIIGWFLWKTAKVGGGDIKMFAMIATYTGITGIPLLAIGALLIQFAVYMIRFMNGQMSLKVPFAPAIALGTFGLFAWQILLMR